MRGGGMVSQNATTREPPAKRLTRRKYVRKRATIWLAVLILAAGALRLGFGAWVVGWDAPLKGDEIDYHTLATHVAVGEGFLVGEGTPTARRPPGYPVVLSLAYRAFGPSEAVGRGLQVALGMVVVWLTFLVGRRFFETTTGFIAAAFAAVNPFLTFISGYLLTENLYMVLVMGALLLLPGPHAFDGRLRSVLGAAVLLGLATLTRPTALLLGVALVLTCVVVGSGTAAQRLERGALAVVVFVALMVPWTLRNYSAFGGWVGLTTHGGITFYQGNNPKVVEIPHYRGGAAPLGALPRFEEFSGMGELERDRFAWRLGREYLRDNLREVPALEFWKFVRFWRLKSEMGLSGIKSGWWWNKDSVLGRLATSVDVGFVYAIVVFPLCLAGWILTRRRARELAFLYSVIVMHTLVGLVFFGSIRGRIPVEPVIAIFAAVAVEWVIGCIRPRRPVQVGRDT